MKHRKYITTFSLIMALAGLSPVVAEASDHERNARQLEVTTETNTPHRYTLTDEQMDQVAGGIWHALLTPLAVITALTVLLIDRAGYDLNAPYANEPAGLM